VAEADAIAPGNLPVESLGGKEVVQRGGGEDAIDLLIRRIAHTDKIG